MEKLIITVAPTGNVPTRETSPTLPLSPEEIAEDVYRCFRAGASMAHIHARNPEGHPTADPDVFREIIARIRDKCDIIIQLSTGARGGQGAEERGACIDLQPEMASLATGSTNFAGSVNYNPPQLIRTLAQRMKKMGVKPEIEVFDLSALDNARYLLKQGIIEPPLHVNLVLNVPGSISGTPRNLFYLVESLPPGASWSVTSIGSSHRQLSALGLVLGGHVRTGLEDLNTLDCGKPVSNPELVKRLAGLATAYGRDVATPAEARAILFGVTSG